MLLTRLTGIEIYNLSVKSNKTSETAITKLPVHQSTTLCEAELNSGLKKKQQK